MSIKLKQVTPTSVPIPIYPIKTFIPISAFMVLLVVIKKLIKDLRTIFSSSEE